MFQTAPDMPPYLAGLPQRLATPAYKGGYRKQSNADIYYASYQKAATHYDIHPKAGIHYASYPMLISTISSTRRLPPTMTATRRLTSPMPATDADIHYTSYQAGTHYASHQKPQVTSQ
ncbi:hypothetical protein P7K49_032105 [Saguinus oedipus]|uniref:Uncharacterized protein n=1 Tax=Saguinus oedipus TaxID=9490 RepID=A0ABQ9TY38_SAGOE|nr:hypothetical protein P7K49_032105 [Saguinus oedipus]